MGVTTNGDSDGGGGVLVNVSVYHEEAEYGRAIHHNAAYSGPLLEDGAGARGMIF